MRSINAKGWQNMAMDTTLPQGQSGLGGSKLCQDFTPPSQAEPAEFRAALSCSLEICSLVCMPTESNKKERIFPFISMNRK